MKQSSITAALLVCALCAIVLGANRFVDPINGNDSHSGLTMANAYRTIRKAYLSVEDGGTVYLKAGTYDGSSQGPSWNLSISVSKNVTFEPENPTDWVTILTGAAPALDVDTNDASKTIT